MLEESQRPQQLRTDLHIVLFREKHHAQSWIASKEDFDGWRYTLEPLYTTPPASQPQALVPLTEEQIKAACSEIYLSDYPQGSASYDAALTHAIVTEFCRINSLEVKP